MTENEVIAQLKAKTEELMAINASLLGQLRTHQEHINTLIDINERLIAL